MTTGRGYLLSAAMLLTAMTVRIGWLHWMDLLGPTILLICAAALLLVLALTATFIGILLLVVALIVTRTVRFFMASAPAKAAR